MKTGRKYGEKEKMQILIKSLIFRTLQIYIFSFYAFLFFVSLAGEVKEVDIRLYDADTYGEKPVLEVLGFNL